MGASRRMHGRYADLLLASFSGMTITGRNDGIHFGAGPQTECKMEARGVGRVARIARS
jgi:hypothetical protein